MRLAPGLLLLTLGWAAPMEAESLDDAVGRLVRKLAGAGTIRTASLAFQNLSSLPPAQAGEVRDAFEAALARSAIQVAAGHPEIRFTLSENVQTLLLIAQFGEQVLIVPWMRDAPLRTPRRVSLKRTVYFEQTRPVLDFLLFDSGAGIVVLEASRVALHRKNSGSEWQPGNAVMLNLARPMPRDARGRLEGSASAFRALAPGSICAGAVLPVPNGGCRANETWVVPGRNYFEGPRGPYFTSAPAGRKVLLAHLDRQARLWGEGSEPLAVIGGWGSDIATIEKSCLDGSHALVSTQDGKQDAVQVFEIGEDRVTPVSEPLAVPGEVTALWPSESDGQITAVVRNGTTGRYEASRVAIACAE